jgi:large subunit ribosomal protein L21
MEIVGGAEALGSDDTAVRLIDLDLGTGFAAFGAAPSSGSEPRQAAMPQGNTTTIEADPLDEGIAGVGPVIERKLHDMGITTFKQIAQWTQDDIERVGEQLNFKGRIEREDWIGQAKAAHLAKYGEQL